VSNSLSIVLEFVRSQEAADPHAFDFGPQTYLLRSSGGTYESARFAWQQTLVDDLAALRQPGRDPALVQRLGEELRRFLQPAGWPLQEIKISEALLKGRRVDLIIRSAAAEIYALPWELLTLKDTGQHVGELPGVLLRYEWPMDKSPVPQPVPELQEDRVLVAWSAAAGGVPVGEHVSAIQQAWSAAKRGFDFERDVLPHASCRRLDQVLDEAKRQGSPISILHLLCHGGAAGSTFGLVLDGEPLDGSVTVDAGRLRQILSPYVRMIRLVVLVACDGGNVGALGNRLGSVAQSLHRAGIAAVVASRYPLSVTASNLLAQSLYPRLSGAAPGDIEALSEALLAVRRSLALDAGTLEWASIQLYAHGADATTETAPGRIEPQKPQGVSSIEGPPGRDESAGAPRGRTAIVSSKRHRRHVLLWVFGAMILTSAAVIFTYKNIANRSNVGTNNNSPRIPDIRKSKKNIEAILESEFTVTGGKIRDISPSGGQGYFSMQVSPLSAPYAEASVVHKETVKPNYFASVGMAAGPGVQTLELVGRRVYFMVDFKFVSYMIYGSETNQTGWQPLRVKVDSRMNTLGLCQNGRQVSVFLNSVYVDSFVIWDEPTPGSIGLFFKADPRAGGTAEFQKLAVWEF
jgi:hypothetical protein